MGVWAAAWIALLLAACGRIDFDGRGPVGGGGAARADPPPWGCESGGSTRLCDDLESRALERWSGSDGDVALVGDPVRAGLRAMRATIASGAGVSRVYARPAGLTEP